MRYAMSTADDAMFRLAFSEGLIEYWNAVDMYKGAAGAMEVIDRELEDLDEIAAGFPQHRDRAAEAVRNWLMVRRRVRLRLH